MIWRVLLLLLLAGCAAKNTEWKLPLDARQVLEDWLMKLREPTPLETEPILESSAVAPVALQQLLGVDVAPITVRLQGVPLTLAIGAIGELTAVGMMLGAELDVALSVDIIGRPWPDVLEALAEIHGIELQVYPNAVLAWLRPAQRASLRMLRARGVLRHGSGSWQNRRIGIAHADPGMVMKQLRELNQGLLDGIGIAVDERTRALVLQGPEGVLSRLHAQVQMLDRRERQVLIEAYVVEVVREDLLEFGAAISTSHSRLSGTADPSRTLLNKLSRAIPESGVAIFGRGGKLRGQLEALQREGLTRILSNPRIFVLNGERAEVFEGSEVPYSTTSDNGTQTQFRQAGLRLQVLPRLYGRDFVNLEVEINKDTVDLTRDNPPITRRHIRTRLVLRHGETLVIGGIYAESQARLRNSVPWLSRIPLLGYLFGRIQRERGTSELMVFLQPRVI